MSDSWTWKRAISSSLMPTRASLAMCLTSSGVRGKEAAPGFAAGQDGNHYSSVTFYRWAVFERPPEGGEFWPYPTIGRTGVSWQQTVGTVDKRASLGHPSQVWTRGLERRLEMTRREVPLERKRILDVGCRR